ncbi:MAG TPA: hypothetical protein VH988_00520 [Thermoanaerobaculia bacterium]|jgi:hypothetical protein|nr:hypothetical protein [Thermoanaerobaculia bacterium]
MKKMERMDDKLFKPLTAAQQKRAGGAVTTQTAVTIYETNNPAPDFQRDGDQE